MHIQVLLLPKLNGLLLVAVGIPLEHRNRANLFRRNPPRLLLQQPLLLEQHHNPSHRQHRLGHQLGPVHPGRPYCLDQHNQPLHRLLLHRDR